MTAPTGRVNRRLLSHRSAVFHRARKGTTKIRIPIVRCRWSFDPDRSAVAGSEPVAEPTRGSSEANRRGQPVGRQGAVDRRAEGSFSLWIENPCAGLGLDVRQARAEAAETMDRRRRQAGQRVELNPMRDGSRPSAAGRPQSSGSSMVDARNGLVGDALACAAQSPSGLTWLKARATE
jgi:hypothetical protein